MKTQTTQPTESGWYWVSDRKQDDPYATGAGVLDNDCCWRLMLLVLDCEGGPLLIGFAPELTYLGEPMHCTRWRQVDEAQHPVWEDADWPGARYTGPERWCGPVPVPS